MKCVIPGANVKILGRAVHSLAKLGDELYVESTSSELSFRTVNASKTAYASFNFDTSFFSFFNEGAEKNPKNGSIKCQISMKSSLAVFRSPITLDKTIESCQIKLQNSSDKLLFHLKYKRGMLRTFYIPIIECETLQAFYTKEKTANSLTVEAKVISNIISNFSGNQDEITWKVLDSKLILRNYSEVEEMSGQVVRTELFVESDELLEYKINKQTEITFCLKELRAVLSFAESVCIPITANFSVPGKPIVFIIKTQTFESNFVVSTLTGSDGTQETDSQLTNDTLKPTPQPVNDYLKNVFKRCFEEEGPESRRVEVLASDSDPDDERGPS